MSTAGLHPRAPGIGQVHPATPSTYFGAGNFTYPGDGVGVASASATFTMPNFSCKKSTDNEWLLPGIWVYNNSSELTQQVDVNFNCNSGTLFTGDVITAGDALDTGTVTVNPGDRVVVSLSETATATVGTVRDITQGTSVQKVGSAATSDITVFIGDEGPSLFGITKVPTFSTIPFSKAQVNGQYLGDFGGVGYNLATTGSTVQIKTGALTGDGDAFTTKFLHN